MYVNVDGRYVKVLGNMNIFDVNTWYNKVPMQDKNDEKKECISGIQENKYMKKNSKLSNGTSLNGEDFDTIELTQKDIEETSSLNAGAIKVEPTEEFKFWSATSGYMEITTKNFVDALKGSIGMSYEDGKAYMQKKRSELGDYFFKNEPEMFALWLRYNINSIKNGQTKLPSGFKLEDCEPYMNKYFDKTNKSSPIDVYA